MPDERVSELTLRYKLDKAAASALLAETRQLQERLDRLSVSARGVSQGASAIPPALRGMGSGGNVDRLRKQVQAAADDFKQLRAETLKANEAIGETAYEAASAKSEAATYGVTARSLTAYGSLATRVGGAEVGQGLGLASDITDAAKAAKLMRAELPQLAQQLGVSTLALGGFGVGIAAIAGVVALVSDQISKSAEEGRKKAQALIDANREYSEIVATGTTESIQAEMAVKAEEIKQKELERDRLEQTILGITSASDQLVTFHGVLMKLSDVAEIGGIEALQEVAGLDLGPLGKQWEQLNTDIQTDTDSLNLLTQAVIGGATAANDLAARQQEYDQRKLEDIQRHAQIEIKTSQQVASWTSQQVEARLAQIETERAAYEKIRPELEALSTTSPEAAQALQDLNDTLFLLTEEETMLTDVVKPAVQAREDEAKAVQFVTGAFGALMGQAEKSGEAVTGLVDFEREAAAKRLDIMAAFAEEATRTESQRALQTTREDEDIARKSLKDQTRFAFDLAESDRQYYEQRDEVIQKSAEEAGAADQEQLKALADFNREDIRRVEDHERRLLQIRRDTGKAVRNAAAQLDAASVVQLLESGGEQIDAENDQYAVEKKRRDEDWADRLGEMGSQRQEKLKAGQQALQDLNAQHQRERNSKITDFNNQLRDEDQERAIRRTRQQQDWVLEDILRQQRALTQLNQVSGFQTQEADLYDVHHANLLSKTDAYFKAAASSMSSLFGRTPTGASAASQPVSPLAYVKVGRTATQYAGGGNPVPGDVVRVGERGSEMAQFMGPWSVYSHGQKPGINITIPFAPGAISVQGGMNGSDTLQLQRGLESGIKSIVQRTLLQFFQESS